MSTILLRTIFAFVLFSSSLGAAFAQSNHSVTLSGSSGNFNNDEKYSATGGSTDYYITFDASNIYIGAFCTSGSFGSGDDLAIYIDTDPNATPTSGTGTTAGQSYSGVTGTLPFSANYNVHVQQSAQEARSFGSSWASTISPLIYHTGSTWREVAIPLSTIGNPAAVYITLWMGYTTGIFSNAPGSNIAASANPTITEFFGGFALGSADCIPANITNLAITDVLTNSVPAAAGLYGKVVVNTGTVTATNNFNIAPGGSIVVSGGTFDVSGRTIQLGGTTIGSGRGATINTSGAGVLTSDASTVLTFNGEGNITGNNLTTAAKISINKKFTPLAGGGLTIENGGVFEINANSFVFTNTLTYATGSTLKYNAAVTPYGRSREWVATSGAGYPYHVLVTNSTGLDIGNDLPGNAYSIAGNLTVDAGSGFYLDYASNDMTQPVSILGNLVLAGNLSLSDASGGDFKVGGNWTHTTGTFDPSSRAVFFNGATGNQTITNASGEIFDYLIIDKATSGNVVLANDVTVNQTLTLTKGLITTSASALLTLSSTASSTAGNTSSYVNGPLAKIGNSAFVFPVGKGGKYARIGLSAPSASSTFKAEYFKASPSNRSSLGTGLNAGGIVSSVEYWEIGPTSGSPSASVTLYWEDNSFTGISSAIAADLVVAHYTSSNWISEGNSANSYGTSGYVTSGSISTWSPFAFGTPNSVNLLPVKLISFTAKLEQGKAKLNWSTAMEKNNDHFEIERSIDGKLFTKIGEVAGYGNSISIQKYEYFDDQILELASDNLYYRLKQVDLDNTFEYTKIQTLKIPFPHGITNLEILPNPFSSRIHLNYTSPERGVVTLVLKDVLGKQVERTEVCTIKGQNNFEMNLSSLPQGVYFINIDFNGLNLGSRMVVKQ